MKIFLFLLIAFLYQTCYAQNFDALVQDVKNQYIKSRGEYYKNPENKGEFHWDIISYDRFPFYCMGAPEEDTTFKINDYVVRKDNEFRVAAVSYVETTNKKINEKTYRIFVYKVIKEQWQQIRKPYKVILIGKELDRCDR